jgi:hypothetical protein
MAEQDKAAATRDLESDDAAGGGDEMRGTPAGSPSAGDPGGMGGARATGTSGGGSSPLPKDSGGTDSRH